MNCIDDTVSEWRTFATKLDVKRLEVQIALLFGSLVGQEFWVAKA